MRVSVLLAGAAMLLAASASGAQASASSGGGSWGVSAFAAGGGQGCGSSFSYDSGGGGSGGESVNPSNSSISNCANSFSGDTAPGLAAAHSQAGQSAINHGDGDIVQTSHETSRALLTTGQMHGVVTATAGNYGGQSQSILWDTLTFNTPGAGADQVTDVPFTFQVDGSFTGTFLSSTAPNDFVEIRSDLQFLSGGVPCDSSGVPNPGCNSFNLAESIWEVGGSQTNNSLVAGSSALASFTVAQNSPTLFQVTGELHLTGPQSVVGLAAMMDLDAEANDLTGVSENFQHTASLSFQPPAGTTFSSASGAFLSGGPGGAPEPAGWAMLLLGFGVIGARLRGGRDGQLSPEGRRCG